MRAMKPNALGAHLGKSLAPVYLLCGPEAFLREEAERAIRSRVDSKAGECEEIILWAGEGATLGEAIAEAVTRPLFASGKFVVLREADDELKRNAEALRSYLRSPPAFSTLVIECARERKGGFKGAVVVECSRLYETEYGRPGASAMSPLGRWLRARASRMSAELSPEAAVGLIEAVGTDLHQLASALELVAANVKRGRAGREEIEELFPRSRTSPAWRLVEALLGGEAESAVELAREALDSGVEIAGGKLVRDEGGVAAMFMVVFAREFEGLQLASAMLAEGRREDEVLKELGVPRHRQDAFMERAGRGSPDACAAALDCILEAEAGFKTGAVRPRTALLSAVTKIGEIWKDVCIRVHQRGR